jgi:hypothetical protein
VVAITADGSDGTKLLVGKAFWFRFRVENRGLTTARDVEVIAQNLSVQKADGRYESVTNFGPLNLKWAYIHTATVETIPRGIERYCDLLHFRNPTLEHSKIRGILEFVVHPNASPSVLLSGKYQIELVAVGSNCAPRRTLVTFGIPDKWADEASMKAAVQPHFLKSFVPHRDRSDRTR